MKQELHGLKPTLRLTVRCYPIIISVCMHGTNEYNTSLPITGKLTLKTSGHTSHIASQIIVAHSYHTSRNQDCCNGRASGYFRCRRCCRVCCYRPSSSSSSGVDIERESITAWLLLLLQLGNWCLQLALSHGEPCRRFHSGRKQHDDTARKSASPSSTIDEQTS